MIARSVLGLFLLFLGLPCAWAQPRILALTPAACEMLFAIGAGNEVVGVSEHCDAPKRARRLPRIADYRRLFVEPALRLNPTLIVAGQGDLPGLSVMKNEGLRVMVVHPTSVLAVLDEMLALGKATGHDKAARVLVNGLRHKLDRLVSAGASLSLPAFYEVWPEPLITEGRPSFITDALADIGVRNVFGNMSMETVRTSVEGVVSANPSVIIVPVSKPGVLAARKAFWHRWLPGVPVVKANADLMQRPGPRLIAGMIKLQQRLMAVKERLHAHH